MCVCVRGGDGSVYPREHGVECVFSDVRYGRLNPSH